MDASLLSILAWAHAEPGLQSDSAAFVVCLGVGALAWSGPRRACMYVFMYVYMYVWHVSSGRVRQPQSALIAPCGAWLAKPQSRFVAWLGGGLPRWGAWRVERRAHSATNLLWVVGLRKLPEADSGYTHASSETRKRPTVVQPLLPQS